jgi:hypothetical protein
VWEGGIKIKLGFYLPMLFLLSERKVYLSELEQQGPQGREISSKHRGGTLGEW